MLDRSGVRRALLARVKRDGVGSLSDEELLSAILTYCRGAGVPPSDELFGRFDGLEGFMNAEFEELDSLRGVSREDALFLWAAVCSANRASDYRRSKIVVSAPDIAASLARRALVPYEEGTNLAIYLDGDFRLLETVPAVSVLEVPGGLSESDIQSRSAELRSPNVIIARNGLPRGLDPNTLRKRELDFLSALRRVNVTLLDIVTLTDEGFTSHARAGFFEWEVEESRKLYDRSYREATADG